jgi:hypothetical protein
MLLLTGHLTGMASRAIIVFNKQSIFRHLTFPPIGVQDDLTSRNFYNSLRSKLISEAWCLSPTHGMMEMWNNGMLFLKEVLVF